MTCFVIVLIAGLLALPRLRAIGFFGANTTTPPDIEITRKNGALGVYINPDLIPSLTADIDSQYGGRTSTNTSAQGSSEQELLGYLTSELNSGTAAITRNLDSGQSITPRINR
jgi:hypothetical protein